MENTPALGQTRRDTAAALARGTLSGIPLIGGVVAEVVDSFIPGQKLDRVVNFVDLLGEELRKAIERLDILEARLKSDEGSDLLEEGIVQASRAVSSDRRRKIARVIFHGLTEDELRYDRIRKLLSILDSLTDSELVLLIYHSRVQTMGSPWHREMREKYPEVLNPHSEESNAPQPEKDRGALRIAYLRSLEGHGLLEETRPKHRRITRLGRLLLRYVEDLGEGNEGTGSKADA